MAGEARLMVLTHATLFSLCLIGQAPAPADRDEDRLFQRLLDRMASRVDDRVDRRMVQALEDAAENADGKLQAGAVEWPASMLVAALTRFVIAVLRKVVHVIVAAAVLDILWSYWWVSSGICAVLVAVATWAGYVGGRRAAGGK